MSERPPGRAARRARGERRAAGLTAGTLRLAAAAKLNLSLAVVGRRADRFHELAGVMVLLDLADALSLATRTGAAAALRVVVDRSAARLVDRAAVPVDPAKNLAWRGLAAAGGDVEAAALTLVKRIPVAAGLGGGSSDAAAAWRLGRRRRGAPDAADQRDLAALAEIGADVPFFAARLAAAYVTGIGERMEPLTPARGDVVIVAPPFGLSTAAVFAELRRTDWSAAPGRSTEPGRNDLLAAAVRLRPEIEEVMSAMRRAGAEPYLTGSGPACFAIMADAERAAAVESRLRGSGLRTIRTGIAATAPEIEEGAHADDQGGADRDG